MILRCAISLLKNASRAFFSTLEQQTITWSKTMAQGLLDRLAVRIIQSQHMNLVYTPQSAFKKRSTQKGGTFRHPTNTIRAITIIIKK